jgi:5-methylcytosine-specific restriction endonuclease McrA
MNHIAFDPLALAGEDREWWEKWHLRATAAALIAMQCKDEGKPVSFQSAIWTDLKRWLLDRVFHGKCAYCESKLVVTDYGDADHYRPKARVKAVPDHTGYFWIAYDWRNLIPCCKHCNTGGKSDSFPIGGRRVFDRTEAVAPQELDVIEKPLLLHPYACGDDHPRKHLEFNEFGHVRPRNGSIRGEQSIELCDLQRYQLVKERRQHQMNAWMHISWMGNLDNASEQRRALMKTFRDGTAEYSASVLDYIALRKRQLNADLEERL